jgi:hypothetical protein
MNADPYPADAELGLYRLPWTCDDNPQCFLEVTLECDVRCRACYQADALGGGHKPLERILAEVALLCEAVNPSAICIVGGEPLLHPQLPEIVAAVAQRRVVPALFSNVLALTADNLTRLAAAGLQVVYGHIDARTRASAAAAAERDRFAALLRAHGGRVYGMISAIAGWEDLRDAPGILAWALANRDVIKYCVFTLDGHIAGKDGPEVADLAAALRTAIPEFRLNTYLDGTESACIHWAQSFLWRGRPVPPAIVRLLNGAYRAVTGRYVSIFHPGVFRVADFFTTVIVRPHRRGTADFCEACPDQTVVWTEAQGARQPRVVHSCLSADFARLGSSPDEEALTRLLARHPERRRRARNAQFGPE